MLKSKLIFSVISVAIYGGIVAMPVVIGTPEPRKQDADGIRFEELFIHYEGIPDLQR